MLVGADRDTLLASPLIILLDLNMLRMNGFEFLSHLRDDLAFKESVVFVMSSSTDPEDVGAAYRYHVAGYIDKASVGSRFKNLVQYLECYLGLSVFPVLVTEEVF